MTKLIERIHYFMDGPWRQKARILPNLTGQAASDYIASRIRERSTPFLVSRFGTSELYAFLPFVYKKKYGSSKIKKSIAYMSGDIDKYWIDKNTILGLERNAGFFPVNEENLNRYSELLFSIIPEIDFLGFWIGAEADILNYMPNCVTSELSSLEPFRHVNPWSKELEGLKVLVISPFTQTIEQQYKVRKLTHPPSIALPEFELIPLKAVQSAAYEDTEFSSWFEALDWMQEAISNTDFDVALIGAGAYGMPLASFIKTKMQKTAIHLGGGLQLMFGINGDRWSNDPLINSIKNEFWVVPAPNERPKKWREIEEGCYW
jgi:hypothetical protein